MSQNLKHLAAKLDRPTFDALLAFAESRSVTKSVAARMLLQQALQEDGALAEGATGTLRDRGYQDGVRRGLHDLHVGLQALVKHLAE